MLPGKFGMMPAPPKIGAPMMGNGPFPQNMPIPMPPRMAPGMPVPMPPNIGFPVMPYKMGPPVMPPAPILPAGIYPPLQPSPFQMPTAACDVCRLPKSPSQFYTDVKCPDHAASVCYKCIQAQGMKLCPQCRREYSANEAMCIPAYIKSLGALQ